MEFSEPPLSDDGPATEIGPIEVFNAISDKADTLWDKREFIHYAPPMRWGHWLEVASHGGRVRYTVSYRYSGNTVVHGQIRYFGRNGSETQRFQNSISIETGNAWAKVEVRFGGNPGGSDVRVTVRVG